MGQKDRINVLKSHLNGRIIDGEFGNSFHGLNMGLKRNLACGIIACVGKEGVDVKNVLMEGLTILQNRGYDSAGICTTDTKELVVSKYASLNTTCDALQRLEETSHRHEGHLAGMAHTRWATHGAKTDINAHPHLDRLNRVAIVHNGVVENVDKLRSLLKEKQNISCVSETDTEVIVQLIGYFLDQDESPLNAIRRSVDLLEGTWGLVIMFRDLPDKLFCVRNGSPVLIGLAKDKVLIASESSAFVRYTREMISMKNGEIIIVDPSGVLEVIGKTTSDLSKRIELAPEQEINLSPDPYEHWTLKEIYEQPEAVSRSLNYGGRFKSNSEVKLGGFEENKEWLSKVKHLVISACGTSYFAGLFGAKLFRHFGCFETVRVIDSAELDIEDFPPKNAALLVISQSGETRDVVQALSIAKDCNIPLISIVNKVGSLIARTTGCGIYINAGREAGVASTKAYTCQVTVLGLAAVWFAQAILKSSSIPKRKSLIQDLHKLPTCIGMTLRIREECQKLAQHLIKHQTLFLLGKGLGECVALEGSLKIKEITYTHAEAYASGALKHGPFALIDEGTPIIVIAPNDKHLVHNKTACHEVKSRGAFLIVISDACEEFDGISNVSLEIQNNGVMTALNAIIPLQFLAYEMAIAKKINPDRPKNLSKTVTVG